MCFDLYTPKPDVCINQNALFFRTFSCPARPAAGLYSRSRLRGSQGVKNESRLGSVARALGVQSLRDPASNRGNRFPSSYSQRGPWKPLKCEKKKKLQLSTSLLMCLKYYSSRQRLYRQPRYNSRASSFFPPYVTATNGASACVYVSVRSYVCARVRHCRILPQRQEPGTQVSRREAQVSFLFSLSPFLLHAVCWCWCCRSCCEPANLARQIYASIGTPMPPFSTCDTCYSKSTTSPRGTLHFIQYHTTTPNTCLLYTSPSPRD